MKRITAIEFINYKAFYESGEENKIEIPEGKSVLLYGENGSGKSSIYEGLKQFLSSTDNTLDVIPYRNIYIPKSITINEGAPNEAEVSSEVAVKVTFTDGNGSEIKTFGVPTEDVQGTKYIAQANLLNSFLSYRELLRTYLMEDPKDRAEFRLKFAELIIESVLSKQKNTTTQQSFLRSWEKLFIPRAWYKEDDLEKFTEGLNYEIKRINLLLPSILEYFERGFKVDLKVVRSEIVGGHSSRTGKKGKHPICEVDLEVYLFGNKIEDEDENHLTVLNEARLSALAISIYFASLINTPQDNFDFKLLFLDDIFIGLDMSNRLPLLEILKNYKKPVIEQFVDPAQNNQIVERLQEINGVIQTEAIPFFTNYQIFISTYDRFWFSVAKNWLGTKSPGKWHSIEMYANKKENLDFTTPIIYTSLNDLQKANYYYSKHDYPSCANHLRKALEERLKVLLPPHLHYAEYPDADSGVIEIKKIKTLNQRIERYISYCDDNGIDASELEDLKNLKDWYFNPFSHDNIGTPIFKRELDIAKSLVENLDRFEFPVLLPAETKLYFRFDNGAGQTRQYKIELQENLRWIKSVDGNILTNAAIQCYEWTQNNQVNQVAWIMNGRDPLRLINFYNNKLNHLLAQPATTKVPMTTLWNEIFQDVNNQPLNALLI